MQSLNARCVAQKFLVIDGGHKTEKGEYEEKIEARLARLSQALENFISTLPAALLSEHSCSRELLEELVVKQSALQWIVRVAKHSHGAIREKLWSDIDHSLAGLEKSLELLPRLNEIERHYRATHERRRSAASSDRP